MANITLYIPDDIHDRMRKFAEIKWTHIIRKLIEEELKKLEEAEYRLYSLSKLKDTEAAEDLFEI